MKRKKYIIITIITFLIITILMGAFSNVHAVLGLGDDLDAYKGAGGGQDGSFVEKAKTVLGLISVIGVVLSVVILIIIGIKYMLGSVEDRAEYKKEMKPYLIGCFILFTGSLVPQIIFDIMQGL